MFDEIALRLLDVRERGDDLAKDRAMKALAWIPKEGKPANKRA
jgi:hypothetical protein